MHQTDRQTDRQTQRRRDVKHTIRNSPHPHVALRAAMRANNYWRVKVFNIGNTTWADSEKATAPYGPKTAIKVVPFPMLS